MSRLNLGLPLICKVNSSALDAPITKKIHVNMEVAPNELLMERPHDKGQHQADVPEGGRLSVTCIAKGAKPQAHIYWNSEPELSRTVSCKKEYCMSNCIPMPDIELCSGRSVAQIEKKVLPSVFKRGTTG